MKTPIYDFVTEYISRAPSRFHMPGHKGVPFLGCEERDITEIQGADVLYGANGIIAESENNASELFKTGHSFYSAQGSTLAIKAMLALVRGENKLILASRNVHKAFVYACALLDIEVDWLYPQKLGHFCSCEITAEMLENKLAQMPLKPNAVYVTSPDYLGKRLDIRALAQVCDRYSVPLLVDNAHGAYLAFLEKTEHPIALGASMCCDSAHKTLPVLTGGAYLHISEKAREYIDGARNALSLFASTSPSYLVLQSLDLCNAYLANGYVEKLSSCINKIAQIKDKLVSMGFFVEETEPLKITVNTALSGIHGEKAAEILREFLVEPEFADGEYIVLMPTPETTVTDTERLVSAFKEIKKLSLEKTVFAVSSGDKPEKVMSIRKAMFAESEKVSVEDSCGRICADPAVSCPPAVPPVISGEKITRAAVDIMKAYGVSEISVVK